MSALTFTTSFQRIGESTLSQVPPWRIASLVPSLTEALVDLGLGPWLVARTGFCIHPAEALAAVPKVGGTKDVNLRKLRQLAPTHVLVNPDENLQHVAQEVASFAEVVVIHPCTVRDNIGLWQALSEVFGSAPGVTARATARIDALKALLEEAGAATWPERHVLYAIWRDPWMTCARDTYLSSMLRVVNWRTWPDVQGGPVGASRYPSFLWTDIPVGGIHEVLLSSEPYRFVPADEAPLKRELAGMGHDLRVSWVDGELCSWYGPRVLEGLRMLMSLAREREAALLLAHPCRGQVVSA